MSLNIINFKTPLYSLALFLIMLSPSIDSNAQQIQERYPTTPAIQTNQTPALPDENTLARLVWSTMIALDNANRTDNYIILNRLGSPEFQTRNSPETLSYIFSNLRENRVDVGRTILSSPNYYRQPEILNDGTLRLRGGFDFRPKSVRFDLIYANINGGWRINAISVVEMDSNTPKN